MYHLGPEKANQVIVHQLFNGIVHNLSTNTNRAEFEHQCVLDSWLYTVNVSKVIDSLAHASYVHLYLVAVCLFTLLQSKFFRFDQGSGSYSISSYCSSYATSFSSCSLSTTTTSYCSHYNDVGLRCSNNYRKLV